MKLKLSYTFISFIITGEHGVEYMWVLFLPKLPFVIMHWFICSYSKRPSSTATHWDNIFESTLQLHFAHTVLIAALLWFEGQLVHFPLFNTLPTKADVIEADSSLFSAVKQRKGTATAVLPLKRRGQLCGHAIKYLTPPEERKNVLCSNRNQVFGFQWDGLPHCCDVFALCGWCDGVSFPSGFPCQYRLSGSASVH